MFGRKHIIQLVVFFALLSGFVLILSWPDNSSFSKINSPSDSDGGDASLTDDAERDICDKDKRFFAVMMSGDSVARPLSGISEANIVVEMPVITGSVNRIMALFNCMEGSDIGSVRSARHDFIPLARGFGAIYAHWGGSYIALNQLRQGVIDNLDALVNPHGSYFRKSNIAAPHNGFTTLARLQNAAQKIGYATGSASFAGYELLSKQEINSIGKANGTLKIDYPGIFFVRYEYDADKNIYLRWRGGEKEMDKNNNSQVTAGNVVVVKTVSRQIDGQYNDVDIEGSGEAIIFQNGREIKGAWFKQDARSPIVFSNEQSLPVRMAPGNIWIEVVEAGTQVDWSDQ